MNALLLTLAFAVTTAGAAAQTPDPPTAETQAEPQTEAPSEAQAPAPTEGESSPGDAGGEAAGETGGEAAAEPAAPATGPRSEDVQYANGALPLAAELLLPAAEGPVPGAVIIQGSGTSDRSNPWARAIAEELRGHGLAVLLTDKRGSGASGGDWRVAGFGDLAGDALAGLGYLADRPEVDGTRLGLVGLSQGGWIAPMVAAAHPEKAAFVISVSGAAVSFAEQTTVEMANTTRQAGLGAEQVAAVLELNRLAAHYLLTGEFEPYQEARQQAMETPWGQIARGFPEAADAPVWNFLRRVASFDPIPYWIQVRQPVLVLYGGEDEADNVPVAESVRRLEFAFDAVGKENHRIVVIPGAGHGFLAPEGEGLLPAFTDTLGAWIEENVTR